MEALYGYVLQFGNTLLLNYREAPLPIKLLYHQRHFIRI